MKTERRHELQTNELADWLGRGVKLMENNARTVVGVAVALAIILAAYFYLSSSTSGRNSEGWRAYFQARQENDVTKLNVLTQDYAGTSVGAWAQLALADDNLIAGTNDLFIDRATANDRLRAAAQDYERVVASKPAARESLLKQRAMWGLARTYESLNELDKARELYSQLAKKDSWKPPLYAEESAHRLADLEQQPTKQFYDWFAQYQPPAAAKSGLDDAMKLDLEPLPDSPPADVLDPAAVAPGSESTEAPAASAEPAPAEPAPGEASAPAEPAPTNGEPAPQP
jgi:hypothetical protein